MAVVHNLLPRIVRSGLGVLDPITGTAALAATLRATTAQPQLIVSPFDWRKLMAGARGNVFPVFKEFEDYATFPSEMPAPSTTAAAPLRDTSEPVEVADIRNLHFRHKCKAT